MSIRDQLVTLLIAAACHLQAEVLFIMRSDVPAVGVVSMDSSRA